MSPTYLRRLASHLDETAAYLRQCNRRADSLVVRLASAICRRLAREESALAKAARTEMAS